MALRVTSDKQGTGVKHISDFVFHQGHGWARLPCSDTWDLRVETVLVIGGVAPLRHSFSIDLLEIHVQHHIEKANFGLYYHNNKVQQWTTVEYNNLDEFRRAELAKHNRGFWIDFVLRILTSMALDTSLSMLSAAAICKVQNHKGDQAAHLRINRSNHFRNGGRSAARLNRISQRYFSKIILRKLLEMWRTNLHQSIALNVLYNTSFGPRMIRLIFS
jgi:hypothetical protein